MKLAVCLLTCDRAELTARTLTSFAGQNPFLTDALRLHADDGSTDHTNHNLAARYGFATVYTAARRLGPGHALRVMWRKAIAKGATHILHLENDWEWVAPIPTGIEADCIRLYGRLKQKDGPRAKTGEHIIGTTEKINWQPMPDREGWEIGVCHWGGPPSICRADLLFEAAMNAADSPKIQRITASLPRVMTARPLENIVWHIG